MSKLAPLLLLLAVFGSAMAEEPWGKASPARGKALHDQNCIACHARMDGGDGSRMYTREGRLLTNKRELLQRVATCSAMAKSGWNADEEAAVAAWLNQQYYHFER